MIHGDREREEEDETKGKESESETTRKNCEFNTIRTRFCFLLLFSSSFIRTFFRVLLRIHIKRVTPSPSSSKTTIIRDFTTSRGEGWVYGCVCFFFSFHGLMTFSVDRLLLLLLHINPTLAHTHPRNRKKNNTGEKKRDTERGIGTIQHESLDFGSWKREEGCYEHVGVERQKEGERRMVAVIKRAKYNKGGPHHGVTWCGPRMSSSSSTTFRPMWDLKVKKKKQRGRQGRGREADMCQKSENRESFLHLLLLPFGRLSRRDAIRIAGVVDDRQSS